MSAKLTSQALDICIASYRRPRLLQKCLESIAQLKRPDGFQLGVHVCDNDQEQSARSVVQGFAAAHPEVDVKYICEPRKNISLARNGSLALGSGELVAFIDDDVVLSSDWLVYMISTLEAYASSIVVGRVEPVYSEEVPSYIQKLRPHFRGNLKTGARSGFTFHTSNLLARREVFANWGDSPFDPAFGETGNEDGEFFRRAANRHLASVWCEEAVAYEYFDGRRGNAMWLIKRSFRSGGTKFAGQSLSLFDRTQHAIQSIYLILRSSLVFALRVLGFKMNSARLLGYAQFVAFNLGTLTYCFSLWAWREYRTPIVEI